MEKIDGFIVYMGLIASMLILLDVPVTLIGINALGIEQEGNPHVRKLIIEGDSLLWLWQKFYIGVLPIISLFYLILKLPKTEASIALKALIVLVFTYVTYGMLSINLAWILALLSIS